MSSTIIQRKIPSEVYDDWVKSVEALRVVKENARCQRWNSLPAWAHNSSVSEVTQKVEALVRETSLHFTLSIIASVEGLFNHQLRFYVSKKPRDPRAKVLGKKFKRLI
jgi:hypothetical protein